MNLEKTPFYIKQESKFLAKHSNLEKKYKKTLKLLKENYMHPSLRLHKIYKNPPVYSISIDMSYRIIMDFYFEEDVILLLNIGDHKVYE
jgi:mRNA-degrading endonuclease RelE of RelBE toxin-antitoxin system